MSNKYRCNSCGFRINGDGLLSREHVTCKKVPKGVYDIIDHATSESILTSSLSATEKEYLRGVLTACKTKLQVYRTHSTGEYQGGMEHTALIKLIEQADKEFCA